MNSKILINIETNEWFIELLKEYQTILLSCIGPINGCLKLVSKSNDYNDLKLTSCSFNLFNILYDLKNFETSTSTTSNEKEKWQFDLIKTIITNCHFEHYYDSGLFLCHLINEFLILENSYSLSKNLIDTILNDLIQHLNSSDSSHLIKCKLDLNNIQFMKKFTSTCLKSKYIINQDDCNETFVNLCLKAYIKSFQDNESFTNLIYLFNENNSFSLSDSQLFDGVLFQTSETNLDLNLISTNNNMKLKCVLFDSSFSGDFEHLNQQDFQIEINSKQFQTNRTVFLMLNKFIELADYLIYKHEIKVFLCQKVIHPSLKVYLRRKNIIFVDRLSKMLTTPLSRLTGCQIVNCSWSLDQFDSTQNIFGYLSSIQLKQILNKNYIHFENESTTTKTLQTMIVCVQNECLTSDLEYLLKVVEFNFQRTVRSGFGLCGGACFYTYCICFLWKQMKNSLVKQVDLMKIIRIVFFKYAKNLLDKNEEYRLDLQSGHLFNYYNENNDYLKCNCGLYKLNKLEKDDTLLINLNDDDINFSSINLVNLLTTKDSTRRTESDIQLIDSFDSKINAFKLAREILASILQIGVFISN